MAEPVRKKARIDEALKPYSLSTVPESAINRIVRSLVGPLDYWRTRKPSNRAILPLCYVSKEWKSIALDTASEHTLRFLKVDKFPQTRSGQVEWRRTLTLRGRRVKFFVIEDPPFIHDQASADAFWNETFSFMPNLKELVIDDDVYGLAAPVPRQVVTILRAAAASCPRLKNLRIYICSYMFVFDGETPFSEITDTLWLFKRGLRQLTMFVRPDLTTVQMANDFLRNLTRSCPQLEVFEHGNRWSDDSHFWMVDLATWAKFNETCTNLRSFDFGHVTFATKFFEIFGQAAKPKLKHLRIYSADCWDWETYLRQLGASDRAVLEASGYANQATNPHIMLAACPNLEELIVDWYPGSVNMNPEIFGDVFCEALAYQCPRLTKLEMLPYHRGYIASLTDCSLRALSQLPFLEEVKLGPGNISGDGLFQLVINHAAATTYKRKYEIKLHLILDETTPDPTFYNVLEGFIQKLVDHDGDLPCGDRSVFLRVTGCRALVERSWSAEYWQRITQLTEAACHKQPAVRLKCLLSGYDSAGFTSIHELVFETNPVRELEWSSYVHPNVASEVDVDDVFVNREYH